MEYKRGTVIAEANAGDKKILTPRVPDVGATEVNFICGKCSTMLVKGFDAANYLNSVIKCMHCGALNA